MAESTPPAPAAPTPAPAKAARPPVAHPMRRRLIRVAVALVVLLVLIVAAVQVFLLSPYAKRFALPLVERELGLRLSADTLRVSLLGHTELTDVQVGLPLDDTSFLKVKTLKVKHNNLFGLILARAVSIDSIEVDQPDVTVVQDALGHWNLQQVVVLLGRLGGSNTGGQSTSGGGVPKLPMVKLVDGTVHVADNQHHTATLAPVNVAGDPQGALVWKYDATIGDQIAVVGEVAPGGNWQHRVKLDVHNLDPLVQGWGVKSTYGANVTANWAGQFADGKVTGTLSMEKVTATGVPQLGDVALTGSVDVATDTKGTSGPANANGTSTGGAPGGAAMPATPGPVVTLHPNHIDLTTTYVTLPDVAVLTGAITYDAAGLHARGLKVVALGGAASLDADADPAMQTIDARAHWSGLTLAKGISQDGQLTASLRYPFPGQPLVKVELDDNGTVGGETATAAVTTRGPTAVGVTTGGVRTPPTRWNAQVQLTGQGSSWTSVDWVLATPTLSVRTSAKTIDLSGLSAHVIQRPESIELANLSLPVAPSTAQANAISFASSGRVDLPDAKTNRPLAWRFDASGGLNTDFQGTPIPVTLAVHASGDDKLYSLKQLLVTAADATVSVDGAYDTSKPTPVDLHVSLKQMRRIAVDAPVRGTFGGDFKIVGILSKDGSHFRPYLTTTGNLNTNDLVVLNRPIGNMVINLTGQTTTAAPPKTSDDPDAASEWPQVHTELHTTDFVLFQAPWDLRAVYPNDDGVTQVMLSTKRLPLDVLAKVAGVEGVKGQLASATWTLTAGGLGLDKIHVDSDYHLTNLGMAGVDVDSVDATLTLDNGIVKLDPLVARSGDGQTTVSATYALANPTHVLTRVAVDRWPYALGPSALARATARVDLDVDLARPSADGKKTNVAATGTVSAGADVFLHAKAGPDLTLAHAELAADMRDRSLTLRKVRGNVLRGTFEGSATIDLDKPLEAAGRVQWQDVDLAAVTATVPLLDGLAGTLSGTVTIAPSRDPRPLEPVRIDVNVAAHDAHFRALQIGGSSYVMAHAVAYANIDRAVLDHSDIYAAGGVVHLWGRVGRGLASQTLLVDFERLSVDQLAHAIPSDKITGPVPGLLAGSFGFVRSGSSLDQIQGAGTTTISQADLINVAPIAALYNKLGQGGAVSDDPRGNGRVVLAFEQKTLRVTSFKFFDRNIDAHGLLAVGPVDTDDVLASKLGGQVVGAVRALKGTRLPLLSDFDDAFTAIQGSLATINLYGTLGNLQFGQAGIDDIGKQMRELLVGDAQASQANSGGAAGSQ